MAVSGTGDVDVKNECEEPLINSIRSDGDHINSSNSYVEGVVDYRGQRVIDRSKFGGWRSASLIIGLDVAETFTYFGITSNLISYLTGPLRLSTVSAAQNINAWVGVVYMLPLLGAFVADSYLGRFRSIVLSCLIYILGLGLLALSATVPSLRPPDCPRNGESNVSCTSPSSFQVIFFFISLYLLAIACAGYKPCAQAFGADQFDGQDRDECKSKGSFFNLWTLGLCFGGISSHLTLNYIQDNLGWGLGFGIPCIFMAVALIVFLFGTKTYRYSITEDKENPMIGIGRVFVAAARNWRTIKSSTIIEEEEIGMPCFRVGAHQFKFLDKALIDTPKDAIGSRKYGTPCNISQVQDAKAVLRLVPIWITCLMYAVVATQSTTFFAKQASTMDRSLGPKFQIPPASIQMFISLSLILFVIIYDRLFVPLARSFTGKPNGITTLQRIGCGIFTSIIAMVVAAVIEKKRLQIALDFGLIDMPKAIVPMRVWWLLPQYILFGLATLFTMVGLQEFFYDQVPDGLRSVGLSFYSSIYGVGSFLSGFLISVIEKVTSGRGHYSWFSDNLNRAHLDYFYWVVVTLSLVQFVAYLYFSKSYLYNRRASI